MDRLIHNVRKELQDIGNNGITAGNLEMTGKLTDILKDLVTIEAMEGESSMRNYEDYRDMGGRYQDNYRGYNTGYERSGGYRGGDKMRERLGRIMDGMDSYEYGRSRYRDGGDSSRVFDGLEKLMYAVCTFVEGMMDYAETPQEKEIIRNHIQKLQNL